MLYEEKHNQRTKTFRVFISSTFQDFEMERIILNNIVFPELKSFCATHNADFQFIDLRWGLSREAILKQRTAEICINELKRCQAISKRPNFVALLGNRYGWQPLPDKILLHEFEAICKSSMIHSDNIRKLNKWYKLDKNAIPPVYCLMPRKGLFREHNIWYTKENELLKSIRVALEDTNLDKSEKNKYFYSLTAQEIVQGLLNVQDANEHVFTMFRNINNFAEINELNEKIKYFGDPNNVENALLSQLKKKIISHMDGSINVYETTLQKNSFTSKYLDRFDAKTINYLNSITENGPSLSIEYLEKFENDIKKYLITTIEDEINNFSKDNSYVPGNYVTQYYLEREYLIKNVENYLKGEGGKPLIIHGPEGSGKTSFLEYLVKYVSASEHFSQAKIAFHFIGVTPDSFYIRNIFNSFVEQLSLPLQKSLFENKHINEYAKQFYSNLKDLYAPVILIIDALDQLSKIDEAHNLSWLFREFPKYIYFITSISDIRQDQILKFRHKTALSKNEFLEVSPLTNDESRRILSIWLKNVNRKLQQNQYHNIYSIFNISKTKTPFYLKLLFEVSRNLKSYDKTPVLPDNSRDMILYFINNLSKPTKHGKFLVSNTLEYLAAGKYNALNEFELLDLLWDNELKEEFLQLYPDSPSTDFLPTIIWSRLRADLDILIIEKHIDGKSLITFFNHQLLNVILESIHSNNVKQQRHRLLANYFDSFPTYENKQVFIPNKRKVSELAFQLTHGGMKKRLVLLLTDFDYLMAKCSLNHCDELLEDFILAKQILNIDENDFTVWMDFIESNIHILRRGNKNWPAHKILLQLANESENYIYDIANQWLEKDNCSWEWVRNITPNRLEKKSIRPVIIENNINISSVMELSDGRIITFFGKHSKYLKDCESLAIWELPNSCPKIKIHFEKKLFSYGAIELPNSRLLLYSDNYATMVIDTTTGFIIKYHEIISFKASKMSDGRIILCDNNIYLLSNDGLSIERKSKYEIDTFIVGTFELSDGRIISWSNSCIYIWTKDLCSQYGLVVNNHEIEFVHECTDSHTLISWGYDNALSSNTCKCVLLLWDLNDGTLLNQYIYSTETFLSNDQVDQVLVLPNGNILLFTQNFFSEFKLDILILDKNFKTIAKIKPSKNKKFIIKPFLLNELSVCVIENDDGNYKDQNILIININSGKIIKSIPTPCHIYFVLPQDHEKIILFIGRYYNVERYDTMGSLLLWKSIDNQIIRIGKQQSMKEAIILSSGNILSWNKNGSLQLWNKKDLLQLCNKEPQVVLEKSNGRKEKFTYDAIRFDNGKIFDISTEEDIYYMDEITGKKLGCISIDDLNNNKILDIGNILLRNNKNTLLFQHNEYIFTKNKYNLIYKLNEFSGEEKIGIMGGINTSSGSLLMWSKNGYHTIIEKNKEKGPKYKASGALELNCGHILSWSDQPGESSLCLWNIENRQIIKKSPLPVHFMYSRESNKKIKSYFYVIDGCQILSFGDGKYFSLINGNTGKNIHNFYFSVNVQFILSKYLSTGYLVFILHKNFYLEDILADNDDINKLFVYVLNPTNNKIIFQKKINEYENNLIDLMDMRFITWSYDSISLWDITKQSVINTFEILNDTKIDLCENINNKMLIGLSYKNSLIVIWKIPEYTNKKIEKYNSLIPIHEKIVHPSNEPIKIEVIGEQYIATWSSQDNVIIIYNLVTGRRIADLVGHEQLIEGVKTLDNSTIVSWSKQEENLRLWRLDIIFNKFHQTKEYANWYGFGSYSYPFSILSDKVWIAESHCASHLSWSAFLDELDNFCIDFDQKGYIDHASNISEDEMLILRSKYNIPYGDRILGFFKGSLFKTLRVGLVIAGTGLSWRNGKYDIPKYSAISYKNFKNVIISTAKFVEIHFNDFGYINSSGYRKGRKSLLHFLQQLQKLTKNHNELDNMPDQILINQLNQQDKCNDILKKRFTYETHTAIKEIIELCTKFNESNVLFFITEMISFDINVFIRSNFYLESNQMILAYLDTSNNTGLVICDNCITWKNTSKETEYNSLPLNKFSEFEIKITNVKNKPAITIGEDYIFLLKEISNFQDQIYNFFINLQNIIRNHISHLPEYYYDYNLFPYIILKNSTILQGHRKSMLEDFPNGVDGITIMNDDQFISWSDKDSSVCLWENYKDISEKGIIYPSVVITDVFLAYNRLNVIKFSSNEACIIALNEIIFWNIDENEPVIHTIRNNMKNTILYLDDTRILISSHDITPYIFDAKTGKKLIELESNKDLKVQAALELPDGKYLSLSKDLKCHLWKGSDMSLLKELDKNEKYEYKTHIKKLMKRAFFHKQDYYYTDDYLVKAIKDNDSIKIFRYSLEFESDYSPVVWHSYSNDVYVSYILGNGTIRVYIHDYGHSIELEMMHGKHKKSFKNLKKNIIHSPIIKHEDESNSLGNLGLAYKNSGQIDKAIEYYEQALAICRKIGNQKNETYWLNRLGIAYQDSGQTDKAIKCYEMALIICRKNDYRQEECYCLENMGLIYKLLAQVEKVIKYYEQGLEISRKIKDQQKECRFLEALGFEYQDLGDVHKAEEYYDQALVISRQCEYKWCEGFVLCNLGVLYNNLGQVEKAIKYSEQSLVIERGIGDQNTVGHILRNLGISYDTLGQVEKSIEYFKKALHISRKIGDKRHESSDLNSIGLAYSNLGQLEKSIKYYEQLLHINKEIGDKQMEGETLYSLGFMYLNLGQMEKAKEYFKQSLPIYRENGEKEKELSLLYNLGLTYFNFDQINKAIEYYKQALLINREIGDIHSLGSIVENIAFAYSNLGQVEQSIKYYEQSLAFYKEIGDKKKEGSILNDIGSVYYNSNQIEKAIEYYKQALDINKNIEDKQSEGMVLNNLGIAHYALRQVNKAIDFYNQALAISWKSTGMVSILVNLGAAFNTLGDTEKMKKNYEQALSLSKEIGDKEEEGRCLTVLGDAYNQLRQVNKAIDYYKNALSVFEQIKSPNTKQIRKLLIKFKLLQMGCFTFCILLVILILYLFIN